MDLRNAGVGKPRFQSRIRAKRTLYLCDECFKGLRADQLHDLFLRLGISDRQRSASTPRIS